MNNLYQDQVVQKKGGPIVRDARRPPPELFHKVKDTARDPRFENTAGDLNVEKFHKSYTFIKDVKQNEVTELQKALRKTQNPEHKSQLKQFISKSKDDLKRREIIIERRKLIKAKSSKTFHPKKSDIKTAILETKFNKLEKEGKLDAFLASKKRKLADKLQLASRKIKK